MTIERKMTFDLTDIRTISYACNKCGARVTFPAGAELEPQANCYNCQNQWLPQPNVVHWVTGPNRSAFMDLLKAINTIKTLQAQNVLGLKMLFELDEAAVSSDRAASDRA